MCTPSNKVKFCTCTKEIDQEKDCYWIYCSYDKEKNEFYVGSPIPPFDRFKEEWMDNIPILENSLNDIAAFDIPIKPKAKDIIEIDLQFDTPYYFIFKSGKWHHHDDCDCFTVMNHYNEIKNGLVVGKALNMNPKEQ